MLRSVTGLFLTASLIAGGFGPLTTLASPPGMGDHACCHRLAAQVSHQHGCAQMALRCCSTPRDRRPELPVPSGQGPLTAPDLTLVKNPAGHPPALPALSPSVAAHAFVAAQLKLPPDPLYLRHLALLV
jgi:hypothetical protein